MCTIDKCEYCFWAIRDGYGENGGGVVECRNSGPCPSWEELGVKCDGKTAITYWELCAKKIEEVYGMQVDWEERFFICPECQEPIYEFDYIAFEENEEGFKCPVCETII